MLFGVEHQNSVLVNDADYHDGPHERHDVEGITCNQQRNEGSKGAQHGGDQNSNWMRERSELEHENDENQQDGRDQNTRQSKKGLPLNPIEPPKFNLSARRDCDFTK